MNASCLSMAASRGVIDLRVDVRRSKQEAATDKSMGAPRIVQSCFKTSLQPGIRVFTASNNCAESVTTSHLFELSSRQMADASFCILAISLDTSSIEPPKVASSRYQTTKGHVAL